MERGLELLSDPAMQQVRDVGLYFGKHAEWLAAASSLPCLTKLTVTRLQRVDSSTLQPLLHARALRRLWVSEMDVECLSAVMPLTQLRVLHVYEPRLDGGISSNSASDERTGGVATAVM